MKKKLLVVALFTMLAFAGKSEVWFGGNFVITGSGPGWMTFTCYPAPDWCFWIDDDNVAHLPLGITGDNPVFLPGDGLWHVDLP